MTSKYFETLSMRHTVYQLIKLHMLEFYYDFVGKYLDRRDSELIQMDTFCVWQFCVRQLMTSSGRNHEKNTIMKGKAEFLSTSKYHSRTPGLFKAEFQDMRVIRQNSWIIQSQVSRYENDRSHK